VFSELGRAPEVGDEVRVDGVVLRVDSRRASHRDRHRHTALMADPSRHRVAPGARFAIAEHDTTQTSPYGSEDDAERALEQLLARLDDLQDRFAAQASHALLIVLQGFDGAGKDSVITNVVSAFDPAILHVFSFNKPVGSESEHDFLWRFHAQTPARGAVHVFDRSYYEEVISARVHDVVDEETAKVRYESITDFERILTRDDTIIVKVFLHVSKDKQAERVDERLTKPDRFHEFSAATSPTGSCGPSTTRPYEDAINATTPTRRRGTPCPPTTAGTRAPRWPRSSSPRSRRSIRSIRRSTRTRSARRGWIRTSSATHSAQQRPRAPSRTS
jgi:polyphosphate kinase 2 (PPK2 family)